MTNRSKTTYTGVTNNLVRRVRDHKMGTGSCFAAKYKLDHLAYFERLEDIHNAIEREQQIKGWLRIKKIALIVSVNPAWRDLSQEWCEFPADHLVILSEAKDPCTSRPAG